MTNGIADWVRQARRQPYAPLLPWIGLCIGLFLLWMLVEQHIVGEMVQQRTQLDGAWTVARENLARHKQAWKAKKDLQQVWAILPLAKEFAPLALGITEEAKREQVTLPALSYSTEKTALPDATKAILHGSITGKYEHLRRFLYDLETAQELVFVEDLNLVRAGDRHDQSLTFNIRIATFLRSEPGAVTTQ